MSDPTLARIIREARHAESLQPAHMLRQQEAQARTIDETGAINPKAAAPFRTPLVMHWHPGSVGKQRVARAGTLAVVAAFAGTAPSTGDAKVTVTSATQAGGTQTIYVLTIPDGQQFADASISLTVTSGSWIGATVTTANGAANVSISITINQGNAT